MSKKRHKNTKMGVPRVLATPKQPSLPHAEPELDVVGRAAQKFQRIILDMEELADLKAEAEKELVAALRDAGRRSIRLGTMTLTLTHKDVVDKIAVKKQK